MYSNKFAAKLVNIRQLWKKDVGKLNIFMVLSTYYPTFRVVYDSQRYEATDYLAWYIAKGLGVPIKNPDIFAASKSLLYKSPQWSYEREWRLIVSRLNDLQNKTPVCIYNIRPKAIYYGMDISSINKKLLHMIAKEKGITEYQMNIDAKSFNYSMKVEKLRSEDKVNK